MKRKLLSICAFISIFTATNAQNVSIPDTNFKTILVANTNINTNNDTEIQDTEAVAYTGTINVSGSSIQDLTGLEAFTEIVGLQAFGNPSLTSIDVSQNTKLTQLLIEQTGIGGILDLSMLTHLVDFKGHTTSITAINMANGNNSNVTRFNVVSSTVDCVQIDAGFTPNSNWNAPPNASFLEDCPTILSVDEFQVKKVSLYPNPTTSVLNIEMNSNIKSAAIYSVLGVKVLETTSKKIVTSGLRNGVYLIIIKDEDGSAATKRFIKQ
ncbi:T9SS type A sorting domain-containing protein [Lacinutrix sp. MEBiC02404]